MDTHDLKRAIKVFEGCTYIECGFAVILYFSYLEINLINMIFALLLVLFAVSGIERLKRKVPKDQYMYFKKALKTHAYICILLTLLSISCYIFQQMNGLVTIFVCIISILLGGVYISQYKKIK